MAEHPLILKTEMVRAILEGRKSQTRTPIKGLDGSQWERSLLEAGRWEEAIKCPWKVGDKLWVRETWNEIERLNPAGDWRHSFFVYKASPETYKQYPGIHWRPSIHMPKFAARIWLEITNIRVERIQDISDEDAGKEGFGIPCPYHPAGPHGCPDCMNTFWAEPPRLGFMYFWDSLYAKKGYGWNTNPWVWIREFKRVDNG